MDFQKILNEYDHVLKHSRLIGVSAYNEWCIFKFDFTIS